MSSSSSTRRHVRSQLVSEIPWSRMLAVESGRQIKFIFSLCLHTVTPTADHHLIHILYFCRSMYIKKLLDFLPWGFEQ